MGTYLNPGKTAFEEAVNSEIFIDKTEMIRYLNSLVKTKQKYVSVSRPRRFGKSMAADMICAYYDREADSRELFECSRLSLTKAFRKGKQELQWDSFLGKFNVIYVVMTDFINSDRGVDAGLKLIRERILEELSEEYPDVKYDPDDLFFSMDRFYRKSKISFVIIIDEWDAVALLIDGGRLAIDTSTYQNDMTTFTGRDDVLSLLIHFGYLGYDDETSEVFIPNKEILDEFRTSTKTAEWVDTFKSFEISLELLEATWDGDAEKIAELVEKAHDRADNKTYNDEAALSYAIRFAYYAAQRYYTILPEADTGKGRTMSSGHRFCADRSGSVDFADLILIPSPRYPDKPALVIELKYNKDADGAISQIKKRNYPDRLEHYKGNTLLVGINYDKDIPSDDSQFKHHSCVIEEA